jgi:DNA (cytosine-5)-methyltransferase 1
MTISDPDEWTCEGQADILELLPRPRLLDLYCCQGGASAGYQDAGFAAYGIDIEPQPRYPFPFLQGGAIEALDRLAAGGRLTFTHPDGTTEHLGAGDFTARHASPPCEDHSPTMQFGNIADHGTGHLLQATIDRLTAWGGPWIVENVEGADMPGALTLCGTEFGLGAPDHTGRWRYLRRHRRFLSNLPLMGAGGCWCRGRPVGGVYGHGPQGHNGGRGYGFGADAAREAMGMPWASRDGVTEAIPPAFTHFLGEQALELIGGERAA